MPDPAGLPASGGFDEAEVQARVRAAVGRTVPMVFLAIGIIYLVGAPFLPYTIRHVPHAPWLAAVCAGMGLGLVWFSRQAQAGRLRPDQAQPVAAWLFVVISSQAVLYQLLLPDQPTTPSTFMLVVGVGLVVVERRYYLPLAGFVLLAWGLLPFLGHPTRLGLLSHFIGLFTATVAGLTANTLRMRGLRSDAHTALRLERRERQLKEALAAARETQATLQAFNEATTEGIVIHRDGVLVAANDAFWAMFRISAESAAGRTMQDHVAPESQGLVERRLRERIEGPAEIEMVRGDGTRFWAEVESRNIVHEGQPARIAIVRDITARRADEMNRRKAEEADRLAFERLLEIQQLRHLDEYKTAFLNTASHELNTPITPVRLQLHLLKSGRFGALAPEQAHSVDLIDRNVARLAALVQDLLDVARLQGGQMRLQRAPADLQRIAAEATDSYAATAAGKGVHLEVRQGPPRPVPLDARRIHQVFTNLLSNAIKFTPAGGSVAVAVEEGEAATTVRVRDTGPGLDASQLARLFQPFSQVHADPALRQAGTGLGLYICRGIVEAHGGRIWAESEGPGRGSVFAFSVPKDPPQARDVPVL